MSSPVIQILRYNAVNTLSVSFEKYNAQTQIGVLADEDSSGFVLLCHSMRKRERN